MSKPNRIIGLRQPIFFLPGADPGEGYLRLVGNVTKISKIEKKHSVTLYEVYDVMFAKGRSAIFKVRPVRKDSAGRPVNEVEYQVVGLTKLGRPLLVVFTVRGKHGMAKRVITARQIGRKSKEMAKLRKDCAHLENEISVILAD